MWSSKRASVRERESIGESEIVRERERTSMEVRGRECQRDSEREGSSSVELRGSFGEREQAESQCRIERENRHWRGGECRRGKEDEWRARVGERV